MLPARCATPARELACAYGPMHAGAQHDRDWTCRDFRGGGFVASALLRVANTSTATGTPSGSGSCTHAREGGE